MEKMNDYYNPETNSFNFESNSKQYWDEVYKHFKNKEILSGKVVGIANNGIYINYNDNRVLMPKNQISLKKVNSFEKYLDSEIDYIIINFDANKNKITISHREVEFINQKKEKQAIFDKIAVGDTFTGIVENLTNYGAFIKLENGYVGLCHISQISHDKIKSPDSILNIGDNVNVKVIKKENNKLSLSIKALLENTNEEKEEVVDLSNINLPTGEATTSLADLINKIMK